MDRRIVPVLFFFAVPLLLLLIPSHHALLSKAVIVSSSSSAWHSSRHAGWRVRAPLNKRAATTNDETTTIGEYDDGDDRCSSSYTSRTMMMMTTARQFKILTCRASACAAQRERYGLDEFATYTALSVRANTLGVPVEETSCLGACQQGPCVAVSHDEYEGNVALQGMTTTEFAQRVFFRIGNDDDADRVWACVEDAIHVMSHEEQENKQDGDHDDDEEVDDDDVAANDRYV
jgi:(2Fe-2S) ferredoxin